MRSTKIVSRSGTPKLQVVFDIYKLAMDVIIWLGNGASEEEDYRIWELFQVLDGPGYSDKELQDGYDHDFAIVHSLQAILSIDDSVSCDGQDCNRDAAAHDLHNQEYNQEVMVGENMVWDWLTSDTSRFPSLFPRVSTFLPFLHRRY